MGLLQDIEGWFGIGKKAATPQVDAAAIAAAESRIQTILTDIEAAENDVLVQNVAAAVPGVGQFLTVAKALTADAQTGLNILKSLTPQTPVTPATK